MPLIQELQNIGLSDKEAKVYLAALEQGQDSVQNIASKANVNRATCYFVLESLIAKGLCSTFDKDKKTYYVANSPESLLSMFEAKKNEIEERKKYFETILPELQLINNRSIDKPAVRFFEGKQGLVNCFQEFFIKSKVKDGEEVRMLYNKDLLSRIFTEEDLSIFRQMRLKKGAKSRVLYNSAEKDIPSNHTGERYRVSEKHFPFAADINIFGDQVKISSLRGNFASILIKDQEIADTLRSLFELAFEGVKHGGGK